MTNVKIYSVGGSIRDQFLGLVSSDEDYVVVGADHDYMIANGYSKVGADFPVYLNSKGEEFALARTERKSGRGYSGFETDASSTITLKDDLQRRDLTINAMARDLVTGEIFDYFNGQDDLRNKILRHVSPAFADDPVRVLRIARFHARYGVQWSVAPQTREFCRSMVADGELAFLTRERVLKEMEKALGEKNAYLFFMTLQECGALDVVFPELSSVYKKFLSNLATFGSTSRNLNYSLVVLHLSDDDKALFEMRLNVSNEMVAYSNLFKAGLASGLNTFEQIHQLDLFRKVDLWKSILHDANKVGIGVFRGIDDMFEMIKYISFEDLPESQRKILKGKEIAEAIKTLRWERYQAVMRQLHY